MDRYEIDRRDSRAGGWMEKMRGRLKRGWGGLTGNRALEREGARDERVGDIESRRAELSREEDHLREEQLDERRRPP